MAKTTCWIQYIKKNKTEKNGDKDGKALHKLMNNAVYGKTMGNLKNKVALTLTKPGDIGVSVFELSKVLMYEFHYDYIKKINMVTTQDYYSQILII